LGVLSLRRVETKKGKKNRNITNKKKKQREVRRKKR